MVQRDRLTPALLQRFRATIDSADGGEIAPQAIHWVLCTPEAATAQLGLDGHPQRSDSPDSFFPPVPHPRRMWASSKVEFFTPIAVDAEIERISTIASISEKSGSTGSLVFVDVEHKTKANGTLAISERQTLVYREANTAKPAPAPEASTRKSLTGSRRVLPGTTWSVTAAVTSTKPPPRPSESTRRPENWLPSTR